jgi:hypothetical protein
VAVPESPKPPSTVTPFWGGILECVAQVLQRPGAPERFLGGGEALRDHLREVRWSAVFSGIGRPA